MQSTNLTFYSIRVAGRLNDGWNQWFDEMTITPNPAHAGETLLQGPVADQAALHGLLMKIRDLNLTLIEVKMEPAKSN